MSKSYKLYITDGTFDKIIKYVFANINLFKLAPPHLHESLCKQCLLVGLRVTSPSQPAPFMRTTILISAMCVACRVTGFCYNCSTNLSRIWDARYICLNLNVYVSVFLAPYIYPALCVIFTVTFPTNGLQLGLEPPVTHYCFKLTSLHYGFY